ncbi:motility associated factor glycosyltransferase family protein [Lysinibacillus sp. SGAir0095]|uniref:motility associated factor glycosyltransferase family protein n=1 Tax=Lysinibacillus sp. SGAir0095 TaxID=2070463 RepID=UPI0010CD3CDB|nr:6-hydroxymethylpterin diphosphokinase MptE-like protein [Lysinibacillus sp. SGAir0095]QCR31501.1 hypothetical protein C1N55_04660 [Lysinibacillus sp. SGAir0095]
MQWDVIKAKNGEETLLLNGNSIYSRYRPREDAYKWIENEFDTTKECYLLIGLGLGYHLEKLAQLAKGKVVYIYYFEQEEKVLYTNRVQKKLAPNIYLVNRIADIKFDYSIQLLIPRVWIKALGIEHPLLPYLEDIKINQLTYQKSALLMDINFNSNILLRDFNPYPKFKKKQVALIASGPSLNETINWLKNNEDKIELFVVGSALKVLLANNIQPSAIVISDPKESIRKQLYNIKIQCPLFYLSTANHETIKQHKGNRHILCQYGFSDAEKLAADTGLPCVETGGSVSTVTFSLLEYLGFETIYLFGLDLGFKGKQTHAVHSTSGGEVQGNFDFDLRKIKSNNGDTIDTMSNLNTYLRWFKSKIQRSDVKVFNTAYNGAKIDNVPYINRQEFQQLIRNESL